MSEQLPDGFRNSAEVLSVYNEREEQGLIGEPYIVDVARDNQRLIFFGSRHTNDVSDKQVQEIETKWQSFVANSNSHKLAMCEGGLRAKEVTKDEAVKKHSETGLLIWLAQEANIEIVSPEPAVEDELAYLYQAGFGMPEVVTYYFGRQMHQWLKRDYKTQPDWRPYAEFFISKHASTNDAPGGSLTLDDTLALFKEVTGKLFDAHDEALLYQLSDPSANPVSAASGLFRDIALLKAITDAWNVGKDLFVLYGSGHAIVLEKALKRLEG